MPELPFADAYPTILAKTAWPLRSSEPRRKLCFGRRCSGAPNQRGVRPDVGARAAETDLSSRGQLERSRDRAGANA